MSRLSPSFDIFEERVFEKDRASPSALIVVGCALPVLGPELFLEKVNKGIQMFLAIFGDASG